MCGAAASCEIYALQRGRNAAVFLSDSCIFAMLERRSIFRQALEGLVDEIFRNTMQSKNRLIFIQPKELFGQSYVHRHKVGNEVCLAFLASGGLGAEWYLIAPSSVPLATNLNIYSNIKHVEVGLLEKVLSRNIEGSSSVVSSPLAAEFASIFSSTLRYFASQNEISEYRSCCPCNIYRSL